MSRFTLRLVQLAGAATLALLLAGCGGGGGGGGRTITVTSLDDTAAPPAGAVTLRSAIAASAAGDTIAFAPALDGGVIQLAAADTEHTLLRGEVYNGNTFAGYGERDYGRSAIFAAKSLRLDASRLPRGITLRWTGGEANPARVLAVLGDLDMIGVTISGGVSTGVAIVGGAQPFTLARGGGLAVWGTATLRRCRIVDNQCLGDTGASRDRGTYGGGIFCNGLDLQECVVSGNRAVGYGAAGGGIYSVGGAENAGGLGNPTLLTRCSVTGNRVTAQHAYGGGIFSLSGGPNNVAAMTITNCTIARNLAEDNPALPQAGPYYYRGGGIYLGGGSLSVSSCTIVENEVRGPAAIISGRPNTGGGGIGATIGNAHVIEDVDLRHSIVAGNKLNGEAEDIFAGSLLHFNSGGFNLIGIIDFRQILVPVPAWGHLSRKRFPKTGDQTGIALAQAVNPAGAVTDPAIISRGTDAGQPALLTIAPAGAALDRVTPSYAVKYTEASYQGYGYPTDDFLNQLILKIRAAYSASLGPDFGASFGDLTGTTWYEAAVTWPSDPKNVPWITFWRNLDTAIAGRLGPASLADDFWAGLPSGRLTDNIILEVRTQSHAVSLTRTDQLGRARPVGRLGDVGAVEL